MLMQGQCTLAQFEPQTLHSPEVEGFSKRIKVTENPAFTARYPQLRTEKVRLFLHDGRVLERSVDLPVGKPPYAFLEDKFFSLAEMTVTHDCAAAICQTVLHIRDDAPMETIGYQIRTLRRK